jgi:hypothetical protein
MKKKDFTTENFETFKEFEITRTEQNKLTGGVWVVIDGEWVWIDNEE